ncbi:MAG: hypothetical protein LQ344_006342 [Seirophora lacunosa]|nr:MAG: hypothetical protein LQ344_006342 [Seirophora lacunosa]
MDHKLHDAIQPANPRGIAILSICIACGIIETLAVALRFIARRKIKARLQIDDWLIFASLWPNYTMIVTGGFMFGRGKAGLSQAYLTREQVVVCFQMLFASIITYGITVTLVRISILFLYRRIFELRSFRIITAGLIAASLAWGVSICAANIFQCHKVSDAFQPEVVAALDGRCLNLQAMLYVTLAIGFTLDLVILLLPFPQIWNLHMGRRRKLELMAILGLGGLSCLASIMRIVVLGSLNQTDLPYSGATNFIWSQIEPSAAILCACFVTYRPLLRDVRVRSIFSSFSKKSASKEEASDVSRRFPTNRAADTDSEEGLIEMKGGMAYGGSPGRVAVTDVTNKVRMGA